MQTNGPDPYLFAASAKPGARSRKRAPGKAATSVDGFAGTRPTVDVASAARILAQGDQAPSTVKLWQRDLGEAVRYLGVGPDGSVLANLNNGYVTLSAVDGTPSPKIEHELLQTTPMRNQDGSTYLVGSWGVARIEPDGTRSWQKYLGSSVFNFGLPTPDGGIVATPCSEGEVHRLTADGDTKWVCELEPKPCYGAEVKGPMAKDGLGRLLMNSQGQLYAVDFETGEKLWSRRFEPEGIWFCNGPVVTPDNHILVNTDSTLQLLRPDGTPEWVWSGHSDRRIDQIPPETWAKDHLDRQYAPMSCPPAISPDGQTLYGGGVLTPKVGHNLVALDRQGNLRWALNLNPNLRVEAIQVGPDGTVYALGTSGEHEGNFKNYKQFTEVHALTPEGEELWKFRTPTESAGGYSRFALDQNTNTVYLAAAGGNVYALRADALKQKCKETQQGGQIQLGGGNVVIVGGVPLKVRRPPGSPLS